MSSIVKTIDEARTLLATLRGKPEIIYKLPENWRTELCILLMYSRLAPVVAMEAVGVTWQVVQEHIRRAKDVTLTNLINLSMDGYFKTRLQDPHIEDVKHPKFLELGIKALTNLLDKDDMALPLTTDQLEAIKEARIQLKLDLDARDELEVTKIQKSIAEGLDFTETTDEVTIEEDVDDKIPIDAMVKRIVEIREQQFKADPTPVKEESIKDSTPGIYED